jgi:hypothetical protein
MTSARPAQESEVEPLQTLIPPDLGRVADEHAVAEPFDEFDEPGAVAAGLYPDDHFAREAGIEAADIIRLMIQLGELDRTVCCIAVANSLLTRVEVHTTIDSHGRLLRGLMRKLSLPQLERSSRRCLLHHIRTLHGRNVTGGVVEASPDSAFPSRTGGRPAGTAGKGE